MWYIMNISEIKSVIFLALFEKYWLETDNFSNASLEKYSSRLFFLVINKNINNNAGISIKKSTFIYIKLKITPFKIVFY